MVEMTIYADNSTNCPTDFFELFDIIGYCRYNGFVFFINRKARNLLFSINENKQTFDYIKYDDTYQPKDKNIIYYILDDSYSIWVYYYDSNHFLYITKSGCY